MSNHHKYSPSRLSRLAACPGSYKLEEGLPDQTSDIADEGTLIHAALETSSIKDLNHEQVALYDFCWNVLNGIAPYSKWNKEKKVSVFNNFDVVTEGSIDSWVKLPDKIIACDFKFGYTKVSEVQNNQQAKAYSLALIQEFGLPVQFIILQPRIKFFDSFIFDPSMAQNLLEEIISIIKKVESDQIIINSGTHCRYCKANLCGTCPTIKANIATVSTDIANVPHTHDLPLLQAREIYPKLEKISKYFDNLKNTIREKLISGEAIEGFILSQKPGNRVVISPQGFYDSINDVITVNEFLSAVKVSIPSVEETYSRNRKESNPNMTLKAIKAELAQKTLQFVERTQDTISIKFIGE